MNTTYRSLECIGFSRYRVGNDGSVWHWLIHHKCWRQLKFGPRKKGYITVKLVQNGKHKYYNVHSLVLIAFCGPCPDGMLACHYPDRNPANNRLENLSWGTPQTNQKHRLIQGTGGHGESNHGAILTNDQVIAIRKLYTIGGYSHNKLAKIFKISSTHVGQIIRRECWIHI